MKSNFNQSREGLRFETRSKRRRTNMILNGLIALVLLLIVIVSVSIFSNNDENDLQKEQAVENNQNENTAEKIEKKTNEDKKTKSATQNSSSLQDSKTKDSDTNSRDDDTEKESANSEVITEGGGDNVQRTIVNPAWEPIGTTQPGPNSSESVDWDERVKALAYAINADESNMTVWYLSRDGGPHRSIGTVTVKGNPQAYRVYLEWQDGDGWKPVKVEELIENDKVQ